MHTACGVAKAFDRAMMSPLGQKKRAPNRIDPFVIRPAKTELTEWSRRLHLLICGTASPPRVSSSCSTHGDRAGLGADDAAPIKPTIICKRL